MESLVLLVIACSALATAPARDATPASAAPERRLIEGGSLRPFFTASDSNAVSVSSFQLDRRPVTNAEYLDFVTANPAWRRSRVKRLLADAGYLRHWSGDLDLGPDFETLARQPVTCVSWFAARAYAAWKGGRLPTTDEWEWAAAVGFEQRDGRNDPTYKRFLYRWYSAPAPQSLPAVGSTPPNLDGIQDLHGLVWEWTEDFNSALVTGDARGDTGLDRQLFCGAGVVGTADPSNFATFLRYGFRSSLRASYSLPNLGFRCAN